MKSFRINRIYGVLLTMGIALNLVNISALPAFAKKQIMSMNTN